MENMKDIAIYTLTSELHDAAAIAEATQQFLDSLHMPYVLRGTDYSDYGQHALNLLYVRTGGTEGIFKRLLPRLVAQAAEKTFYLLTSGKSNSLAASMEILSYLRQQGLKGEIIHGSSEVVSTRLQLLARAGEARKQLRGMRLGIVGEPSDWLISSHADAYAVYQRWGITLVEIPMKELLGRYEDLPAPTPSACDTWLTGAGVPPMTQPAAPAVEAALPGAMRIYRALRQLVADYHLDGFTLRCFDLLDAVHNTGCMALARLNAEGILAGCEGDVPALLSMAITKALLGVSGFQANPARIDTATGEMWFAHCTIPLNMIQTMRLDTHFESGIGVGICGVAEKGAVTIFKASATDSRYFVAEGMLTASPSQPDLCRTQQVIMLADKERARYFLTEPIGNHHIIVAGHHRELYEEMMRA